MCTYFGPEAQGRPGGPYHCIVHDTHTHTLQAHTGKVIFHTTMSITEQNIFVVETAMLVHHEKVHPVVVSSRIPEVYVSYAFQSTEVLNAPTHL